MMERLFAEVRLSRQSTLDLVNQVVIPTVFSIEQHLLDYGHKMEAVLKKESLYWLSLYSVAVAFKPEKTEHYLTQFVQSYCHFQEKDKSCETVWCAFRQRLVQWLEASNIKTLPRAEIKARIENIPHWQSLKEFCCEKSASVAEETAIAEEDFWVETSAESSSEIDQLHTSDQSTKVLTALEFVAQSDLDRGYLQDLQYELEDIHNILSQASQFNEFVADRFILDLTKLSGTLHHSIEFESMGLVLEQLMGLVRHLVNHLEEDQKPLLLLLLKQLVEDLMDWFDHIFILQDAVDIHYLDAALLASISQIEVLFASSESESETPSEDEDFMLF